MEPVICWREEISLNPEIFINRQMVFGPIFGLRFYQEMRPRLWDFRIRIDPIQTGGM